MRCLWHVIGLRNPKVDTVCRHCLVPKCRHPKTPMLTALHHSTGQVSTVHSEQFCRILAALFKKSIRSENELNQHLCLTKCKQVETTVWVSSLRIFTLLLYKWIFSGLLSAITSGVTWGKRQECHSSNSFERGFPYVAPISGDVTLRFGTDRPVVGIASLL